MTRRILMLFLVACGPAPVDAPTPVDAGECAAYAYEGQVYDCRSVSPCDDRLENLAARLACCACDAATCEPPDVCELPLLPALPPDLGPPVAFVDPLAGEVLGVPVTLFAASGGLVLSPVDPAGASAWACPRDRNTLRCEPGGASLSSTTRVEILEVRLTDADGDGVADGGLARATGSAGSEVPIVGLDPLGPAPAGVVRLPHPALPGDALRAVASLPVDPAAPALVAGGPVPLEPELGPAGLVAAFVSPPVNAEWATPILGEGAALDLAGRPLAWEDGAFFQDPGPADANLGFEAVDGWVYRGFARDQGGGLGAYEGERFMASQRGGALVGRIAVPAEASELGFSWGIGGPLAPTGARLLLLDGDARIPLWTLEPADIGPCAGVPCAPWAQVAVDLTPWAGSEVLLRFEVDPPASAFLPTPPPGIDFGLDALVVR